MWSYSQRGNRKNWYGRPYLEKKVHSLSNSPDNLQRKLLEGEKSEKGNIFSARCISQACFDSWCCLLWKVVRGTCNRLQSLSYTVDSKSFIYVFHFAVMAWSSRFILNHFSVTIFWIVPLLRSYRLYSWKILNNSVKMC